MAIGQRAVALGLFLRGGNLGLHLLLRGLMLGFGPGTQDNQVLFKPGDRVAQRKASGIAGRSVFGRVVRSRVGAGAVGDPLDQCRPQVRARPLQCPLGSRVDRQKVIAIDPQRSNTAANAACRKSGAFTASDRLKSGDGPLVVDHVQNHRRAVNVGEGQSGMKVGFCRGAVANPARRHLGVALDGRSHGPADGLNHLCCQVAGDGEEALLLARIHDRQLASFERVVLVGKKLADHVHHRGVFARQQKALLAVGRKAHIAFAQGHRVGGGDRLFAQTLHVERDLFLSLRNHHACIKGSGFHHGPQAVAHPVDVQIRYPGSERLSVFVEHPYQRERQVAGLRGCGFHRRASHAASFGDR